VELLEFLRCRSVFFEASTARSDWLSAEVSQRGPRQQQGSTGRSSWRRLRSGLVRSTALRLRTADRHDIRAVPLGFSHRPEVECWGRAVSAAPVSAMTLIVPVPASMAAPGGSPRLLVRWWAQTRQLSICTVLAFGTKAAVRCGRHPRGLHRHERDRRPGAVCAIRGRAPDMVRARPAAITA
jgi:hypothetical protein